MAYVAPFRALRYDPRRVAISDVVTQPYDKITKPMQARYYAASPYNLVRIILGTQDPGDGARQNAHTRAAGYFSEWRRQGIFFQDPAPSIYRYTQRFKTPGATSELERRGFIALGKLEDYSASIVFRHEQTFAKPKADRLELLRATRAHFGQIFMLYSDPANEIDGALTLDAPPDLETTDEYGVLHQVWRIADPSVINFVGDKMLDKKLIIADGHHRYETALNYRDERRAGAGQTFRAHVPAERRTHASPVELQPYEFAMMTFVNLEAPGLVILPTHRVVHGLASFSPDEFRDRARAYFSVEEVDPSIDAGRATRILREAGHAGTALLAVAANRAYLVDTPKTLGSEIFEGLSLRQLSLDVVTLHRCLLQGVLGISDEAIRGQENISFVREAAEALTQVRSGAADIAFLMNPPRIRQVRDVALAGEAFPQKTTDFYPKLLSGLTIYPLE